MHRDRGRRRRDAFPMLFPSSAADSMKPDEPDEETQMENFSFMCEQQLGSQPEPQGAEKPRLFGCSSASLPGGNSNTEICPVVQ